MNLNLKHVRAEATRKAIAQALRSAKGNRTQAAKLLGLSRSQLHRYLADLGIRTSDSAQ